MQSVTFNDSMNVHTRRVCTCIHILESPTDRHNLSVVADIVKRHGARAHPSLAAGAHGVPRVPAERGPHRNSIVVAPAEPTTTTATDVRMR